MRAPVNPRKNGGTSAAKAAGNKAGGKQGAGKQGPRKQTSTSKPKKSSKPNKSLTTAREEKQAPQSRISGQFTQRLDERRRALRRLRWRTVAVVVLILAALGGAVYVVGFSSVLALRAQDAQVQGANEFVDTEAIDDVIAAQDGVPLIRLNTAGMSDQIADAAGVLEVSVSRSWPNGLAVQVTPREPVAVVESEGEFLLMDPEGIELDSVSEPPEDLPLIDVDLGSERSASALQAVVQVLGELPPEVFDDVTAASAASADRIEFELGESATVIWGSAEETELKAEVLLTLRQVPAEVYDVSAPRNPITKNDE